MKTTGQEFEKPVGLFVYQTQKRVQKGLQRIPQPAADFIFSGGQAVYVSREDIKHSTGPYLFVYSDGKTALLDLGGRTGCHLCQNVYETSRMEHSWNILCRGRRPE